MVKKLVSLFLTAAMLFMLAVPSFAVKAAKFSLKKVSETDGEIVLSIDYEGGSTFNCIDFEVDYNDKKLKPVEAYDGDGLEAFIRELKKENGAGVSAINKESKPIKGSMAVTSMFKVVNGKDLFIIRFKKLAKEKVTSDDIDVIFTNCASENEKIQASITNQLSGSSGNNNSAVTKISSDKKNNATTADKSGSSTKSDATAAAKDDKSQSNATDQNSDGTVQTVKVIDNSVRNEDKQEQNESQNTDILQKSDNAKKIVVIAAIVCCAVLVLIAVFVYLTKKKGK